MAEKKKQRRVIEKNIISSKGYFNESMPVSSVRATFPVLLSHWSPITPGFLFSLNFPQKHELSLISCTDLCATSQKRARQWLGQSNCWCSSLMSCFEGKTLLRSSWASGTVTLHRSFSDLFNLYKPTGIPADKSPVYSAKVWEHLVM